MNLLLVVACHNDINLLNNWLDRIKLINIPEHTKIIFIDTYSDNEEFKTHFSLLKEQNVNQNLMFERLDYICYASGAYWYTYLTYTSNHYIFLHDSNTIIDLNFLEIILEKLKEYNIVSFFDFQYDHFLNEWSGTDFEGITDITYPQRLIVGPMFATTKTTLDKIPHQWFKIPQNKTEEEGCERRWALMFHLINATKINLLTDWVGMTLPNGFLHKILVGRR